MVQLTDKHWALELPDDANGFGICYDHFTFYEGKPSFQSIRTIYLPGNWKFLFTIKEATEEQAAQIVDYIDEPFFKGYREYEGIKEKGCIESIVDNARYSLESLLKSKGCDMNKNWAIILKQTDNGTTE